MIIRAENKTDWVKVHQINAAAFETPVEAKLVDTLRGCVQPLVSLVADDDGDVVGHIMFSPVSLGGHASLKVMGLAPMAVAPEHQRKGSGSKLVHAGIAQCRRLGFAAVVVLGDSAYYSRFGFSPSARFGIDSEYDVPEDFFMAMELASGILSGKTGTVKYDAAFQNV